MAMMAFILGILFMFTLAYLYFRYPLPMFDKALRRCFSLYITDTTARRIAYLMGTFAAAFGLMMLVMLLLALVQKLSG